MLNKRLYFFTLFIVRAYTTKSLIWHHAVYNFTMLLSSFTFFFPTNAGGNTVCNNQLTLAFYTLACILACVYTHVVSACVCVLTV